MLSSRRRHVIKPGPLFAGVHRCPGVLTGGRQQEETAAGADTGAEGPRSRARVRLGRREAEVHQQVRGVLELAQETLGHVASAQGLPAGPGRDAREETKAAGALLPGSLRAHVRTTAGREEERRRRRRGD